MGVVLFVIVLGVLVLVHELGHFLVAKKSGIRVDEFGIGFPPRLFDWRRGETSYSINLIPFGGFVKIVGESPTDLEGLSPEEKRRTFPAKSRWTQAGVLAAGVISNWILAWVLISASLMIGMPTPVIEGSELSAGQSKLLIYSVAVDSPAEAAGLKAGDELVFLATADGEAKRESLRADLVSEFINEYPDKLLVVGFRRGNVFGEEELPIETLQVDPEELVPGGGEAIGISLGDVALSRSGPIEALWRGAKLTGEFTYLVVVTLGQVIGQAFSGDGDVLANLTGPVGIIGLVGDAADLGFVYLISLTALISIHLAVINLVPIPALDGGRLLFLLIEAVRGRPIKPSVANALNSIGFILLILLMVVITFFDISKLF